MLLVNIDWWLVDNNWIDILSLNLKARFPDLGWSNYLFLQENEVFGLLYQQKSVCCLKEFPKVFLHWNWWSFYFSNLFWGKGCWYRSQSDEISQCLVPYDFHETICVKSWIPVQDTLSAYVIGIHFKINSKISFKSVVDLKWYLEVLLWSPHSNYSKNSLSCFSEICYIDNTV